MGLDITSCNLIYVDKEKKSEIKKYFCYILFLFKINNLVISRLTATEDICLLQHRQTQSPVLAAAHRRHQPPGQKLGSPPPLDHLPSGGVLQTGEWKVMADLVVRYKKSTTVIYTEPAVLRVHSGCN